MKKIVIIVFGTIATLLFLLVFAACVAVMAEDGGSTGKTKTPVSTSSLNEVACNESADRMYSEMGYTRPDPMTEWAREYCIEHGIDALLDELENTF